MKNELYSLDENHTWDLVEYSKNSNYSKKPLKSRWVYKLKEYSDNTIEFKARFVAKGFEQLYGIDYIETFASVIKQIAWKLLFALAVLNNQYIYKIDIISTFIQGSIDTNIYLFPPKGFNIYNNYILRLNKALYGLKQSARIWYTILKEVLIKLNFEVLNTENCIFINRDLNIIITIYVDDLAIIGPNLDSINNFIKDIQKYFNIKLLGPIKDYLGVEIKRDSNTLKLHQTKYINSVLNKFNIAESKPVYTLIDSKVKLEPNPNIATLE